MTLPSIVGGVAERSQQRADVVGHGDRLDSGQLGGRAPEVDRVGPAAGGRAAGPGDGRGWLIGGPRCRPR